MFLLERIIGISTYTLVLIISCLLLLNIKPRQRKSVFVIILAMLTVMAFLNEPHTTSDLFRIRQYARHFASQDWGSFWESIADGSSGLASSPSAMVYYKLLGSLPDIRFISMVSGLISYSLIFYMMQDFSIRFKISNSALTIGFFAFMAMDYFIPITSTIRSYLATVLVCFCIYRETVQNRFGWINPVLYLITLGMHDVGLILVEFRVGCFLINRDININKSKWNRYRMITLAVLVICSSILLPLLFDKLGKADGYMEGDVYSYDWEYRLCLFRLAVLIMTWIVINRYRLIWGEWINRIWIMLSLALLLMMVCVVDFTFLMRICFFTELLWILPVMLAINRLNISRNFFLSNLWILSGIFSFILSLARGYLCSLKFW